jgi:hypothetical protein
MMIGSCVYTHIAETLGVQGFHPGTPNGWAWTFNSSITEFILGKCI